MDAIILNQKVRYFFSRETVGEFPTANALNKHVVQREKILTREVQWGEEETKNKIK